jgi:type VI protein secretion system component VasK
MREMRIVEPFGRNNTPLVVKASLPRVFLGLGLFTETLLLFCGSYLLAEAIVQPLDAGTFSVIGGGLLLALATVLLFYLAWPGRKRKMSLREKPAHRRAEVLPREHLEAVQTQRQSNWTAEGKKELAGPF